MQVKALFRCPTNSDFHNIQLLCFSNQLETVSVIGHDTYTGFTHTHIFKREHFLNEGFYVGVSFSKTALVICNPFDTVEFCVLLEQLAHVGTVSHHAFQLLVNEVLISCTRLYSGQPKGLSL